MLHPRGSWLLTIAVLAIASNQLFAGDATLGIQSISVEPSSIRLTGPRGLRGLLVHGTTDDGTIVDLTHRVSYRSTLPDHLSVDQTGVARAVSNGVGAVEVAFGRHTATIPVQVEQIEVAPKPHFENDVIPILSKYGCNSSGCHGKAEGQNGFKLSVFGFDPAADYDALTKEGRGRRTFPAAADKSLLLTKLSGATPHGGGIRLTPGSREYNMLRDWIAAGTPLGDAQAPRVERIDVSPGERILETNSDQQLRVMAYYSDGRELDVTQLAKYQSNNDGLAAVDENGRITIGKAPGSVAIMASFMGAVNTFQALIPRPERIVHYPALREEHFVDRLVHAKLKKLNILPSGRSDDGEFLRRVYLDIIGTLPTAEEAHRFLNDPSDQKRSRLVDELLERPEYADYWALRWSDMLRVDRLALGHKRAYAYYRWIRDSVVENKKLDQFAREILTLKGRISDEPQANFYAAVGDNGKLSSTVSQVFLGVRIACAECHHHPFDRWSQTDYYGMSAFFQQVSRKGTPRGEIMTSTGDPETKHPRTGKRVYAHPLGSEMPAKSIDGDRRQVLADWMTSPQNPWFARNFANRIWAHFMGRGLVEPVDDIRETNPPTNPELLDALAARLIESGYDAKHLIRTIAASGAYQRSSEPNPTNEQDEQNYSRALLKRLDAEVLLDAVCQVTGIDEKFQGVPHGHRAIQLWDSEVDHYFLKSFGRSTRKSACECERVTEPTVGQVLHILNSPEIHHKLSHEAGRVADLANSIDCDAELIDRLYLTYLARNSTADERRNASDYFDAAEDRRSAAEDLAWSLMNTLEFLFNH